MTEVYREIRGSAEHRFKISSIHYTVLNLKGMLISFYLILLTCCSRIRTTTLSTEK